MPDQEAIKKIHEETNKEHFSTEEVSLGPWTSHSLIRDPKHMCFVLSRYKFAAKMIGNKKTVVEVGCGDGFGLPILAQAAEKVFMVDWDKRHLDGNERRLTHLKNVEYIHADLNDPDVGLGIKVGAVVFIDVIEHLEPSRESIFMNNMVRCLDHDGVIIIGTPNETTAKYSSSWNLIQHVNLKNMDTLRELTEKYFKNVFMFGMNDEVLHTGFSPMCHYIWSIGAGVKEEWLDR